MIAEFTKEIEELANNALEDLRADQLKALQVLETQMWGKLAALRELPLQYKVDTLVCNNDSVSVIFKTTVPELEVELSFIADMYLSDINVDRPIYFALKSTSRHEFSITKLKQELYHEKLRQVIAAKTKLETISVAHENFLSIKKELVERLNLLDKENSCNWQQLLKARELAYDAYLDELKNKAEMQKKADDWKEQAEQEYKDAINLYCQELAAAHKRNNDSVAFFQKQYDNQPFYWARLAYAVSTPEQLPYIKTAIVIPKSQDELAEYVNNHKYIGAFENGKFIKKIFYNLVWIEEPKLATPVDRTPYRAVEIGDDQTGYYTIYVPPFLSVPRIILKDYPEMPKPPAPPDEYQRLINVEWGEIINSTFDRHDIDF